MKITPEMLSAVANQMGQLANWQQRTWGRPEPYGSQDGEDAIIADLFPGVTNGCYVDIGAGEAISCSNTYRLWEKGWRGLLVEPRKDAVYDLCYHRWGDVVYPVCASNYIGTNKLYLHGSVSSMRAEWNIEEQAAPWSETETMHSILAKFPVIRDTCQLCSIDVEGAEREVLEGIDWATFRPKVFVVEYLIYGASPPKNDNSAEWEPMLLEQGYKLEATTGLNKIYVRA